MKTKTSISRKECIDTGMALTLVALLLGFYTKKPVYFTVATGVLVLNMVFPRIYYPVAIGWFWLSDKLSIISSIVLLTLLYVLLVVPIGWFRQLTGKDSLQLRQFKKSQESVMRDRQHTFVASDIHKPY